MWEIADKLPTSSRDSGSGGKIFCHRVIQFINTAIFLILVFCIGAFVLRIDNGWLNFPQISSSNTWEVLLSGLTTHLFMVGIAFGILTASAFKEKKSRDPYGFKRFFLSLAAVIFTWLAMYLDVTPYSDMARDPNAYAKPIGIFDWLIGHACKEFDYQRLWFHQSIGVSLYGLTVTAPFGICLYIAGYGWEYLFCGIVIDALYEIGFRIASYGVTGLDSGESIGQALWGGWLCLVLFVNLVGKYKSVRNVPVPFLYGRNKFFGICLTLIDLLYIGCIIGESFANIKTSLKYRQSLMSLITLIILSVIIQIVWLVNTIIVTRKSNKFTRSIESNFDQIDSIAEEGRIQDSDDTQPGVFHVCRPYAKFPFNIIAGLIRLFILAWSLWFIILLLNTIIQDRIMAPCPIPWEIN